MRIHCIGCGQLSPELQAPLPVCNICIEKPDISRYFFRMRRGFKQVPDAKIGDLVLNLLYFTWNNVDALPQLEMLGLVADGALTEKGRNYLCLVLNNAQSILETIK